MPGVMVITGASSGIGAATARAALGAGWQVALIARRGDALTAVASGHEDALCLPCDVRDADRVETAFDAAIARFGRIDVLFNNAGIFPPARLIDEITAEEWREAVDINLTGMFLCAHAAFRRMRTQTPQGGRIINNGSISAHAPRPGSVAYTTTKHAITGLTKSLELDGRAFDITAGQIDIGNARTELAAPIEQGARQADGTTRPEPMIDLAPVVDAVLHMAQAPRDVAIPFLTITAAKMPWIGRG